MSLPKGWEEVTLKDIGKWGSGGTPKRTEPKYYGGDIPWLIIGDINDGYVNKAKTYITQEGLDNSSAKLIPANTLLIAMYGSIGKLGITQMECSTNQAIAYCLTNDNIVSQKFVFYYLLSVRQILLNQGKGGAQQNISQTVLKAFPFPLPPLTEQKQIAKKLDKLLARVERIKSVLDNAPAKIKRFRQSVLASAVGGGFSEDKNWESLTIDDVVHVKGGKRLPKGEKLVFEDTGFPYIKAGQLKKGTVNPNKQEYLTADVQQKIAKYIVKTGDVYITIVGACIGDAGIIPKEFNNANLTENAVKLCEFKREIKSEFLSFWMRSYYIQNEILSEIKSGAQGKLAIKRIKTLPFNLPPLEEQKAIVKKVETLFAIADKMEANILEAQKRVDKLTQSILAKAFCGEL